MKNNNLHVLRKQELYEIFALCPKLIIKKKTQLDSIFPTTIYGITSIQRKYSLVHFCTETSLSQHTG